MSSLAMQRHPLFSSVSFALLGLTVVGQIYLPIPILARIQTQFGSSAAEATWVSSAFSFAYAAGFLLSGPLSDKFGRRHVMLTGFLGLIAATLLVARAGNFQQLLGARVLQGLSASAFPPLILAYLNESLEAPWRGKAISFMSLGFLTASIIAQLYAIVLSGQSFGLIEMTFLPLYVIALILVFAFVDPRDGAQGSSTSLIEVYRKIPALLFEARLKWLYLSTLCTLSALVAFYILLDRNYGAQFSQAGIDPLTTRLVALPAMFLSLFAPQIIARIGSISLIRWSFAGAAFGLGLAVLAVLAGSTWGLLAASVVFIAGRAFSVPSLVGTVGRMADPAYRGTAISLYTFVLFIGASLGPVLARLLFVFPYAVALVVLAVVAGLPAVLTGFMQSPATAPCAEQS